MSERPLRILVLVNGRIGPQMSGPEIRGWEIARELARDHTVTAATSNPVEATEDGVRILPASRRRLLSEAASYDVVIGPSLPPYLLALLRKRGTTIVTDQYDPVDLELATLGDARGVARAVETQVAHRRLQLRFADVVLCAGQRQRERLENELHAVGRSSSNAPSLAVLPMGIAEPPAPADGHPLRDRFGLSADDFVVFWWGNVWRWFDAETAVRAVARAAETEPRIKLVVTASRPPEEARRRMLAADSVTELAESLGVLGRHVFLLDEWVPFTERGAYLQDADAGISLHRGSPEADLAARARYMDYLWAGVPCVLADGDEVAHEFGEAGFSPIVPPGDVAAVEAALLVLARDPDNLRAAREAGRALAERYRWSTLVAGLRPQIEAAVQAAPSDGKRPGAPIPAVAGYYRRRAADRILDATPWASA